MKSFFPIFVRKIKNNSRTIRAYGAHSLLVLILFVLVSLSGCGLKVELPVAEPNPEEENLIVIGFSQIGSESRWRTANTASIQTALSAENGYFLNFSNARQKQENQIRSIREYISRRVDYIVFSPVTEYGWEKVLEEAREAKIPVILIDRKIDVDDRDLYMTWVGSDMKEEGRKAAWWLETYEEESCPKSAAEIQSIEALTGLRSDEKTILKMDVYAERDPINIVVLLGTENASATIDRSIGFHQVADIHSNWNILEEVSGDFTTARGQEVMEELLKKYPDIDVVVSQNDDMTFGAIEAIEQAGMTTGIGGDIAIISFDAVYEALLLVQQGKINVDIECNPLQGPYVNHIIESREQGFTILKSTIVDEEVFTIDNVDEYIEERQY